MEVAEKELYLYHVTGFVPVEWLIPVVGQSFLKDTLTLQRAWRSAVAQESPPPGWGELFVSFADMTQQISTLYGRFHLKTFRIFRPCFINMATCSKDKPATIEVVLGPFEDRAKGRRYAEKFAAMAPLGVMDAPRVTEHRRLAEEIASFDEVMQPSTGYSYEPGGEWELDSHEFSLFDELDEEDC